MCHSTFLPEMNRYPSSPIGVRSPQNTNDDHQIQVRKQVGGNQGSTSDSELSSHLTLGSSLGVCPVPPRGCRMHLSAWPYLAQGFEWLRIAVIRASWGPSPLPREAFGLFPHCSYISAVLGPPVDARYNMPVLGKSCTNVGIVS